MPTDVITTAWDDPRNVETLKAMWADRRSASEIAYAIGQGVTKNAVVGKAHRLKLEQHGKTHRVGGAKQVAAAHAKRGGTGGPGQVKASTVRAARNRAEDAKQHGLLAHRRQVQREPFREGTMPELDVGIDVTHLIGFRDRRIGRECSFIPGDPAGGAMCCGKPVKEGTEWCPEHHARVFKRND